MFRLVRGLDVRHRPTCFLVGPDDALAGELLARYSRNGFAPPSGATVAVLPRPRVVGQWYFTSVFTALWALIAAVRTLLGIDLDLVGGRRNC